MTDNGKQHVSGVFLTQKSTQFWLFQKDRSDKKDVRCQKHIQDSWQDDTSPLTLCR
jgi:hypothetical protein